MNSWRKEKSLTKNFFIKCLTFRYQLRQPKEKFKKTFLNELTLIEDFSFLLGQGSYYYYRYYFQRKLKICGLPYLTSTENTLTFHYSLFNDHISLIMLTFTEQKSYYP